MLEGVQACTEKACEVMGSEAELVTHIMEYVEADILDLMEGAIENSLSLEETTNLETPYVHENR